MSSASILDALGDVSSPAFATLALGVLLLALAHPRAAGRPARRLMRSRAHRRRHALAAGYATVLDDAFGPPRVLGTPVPVRRDQVLVAYPEIRALIARLRDDIDPPCDAGVHSAELILCEGASPLFTGGQPGPLRRHLRVIRDAMD